VIKMEIKYRKMSLREIELSNNYIKKFEELKPKSNQMLADYKRCLKYKKSGWKNQVSQNVRGVCI